MKKGFINSGCNKNGTMVISALAGAARRRVLSDSPATDQK